MQTLSPVHHHIHIKIDSQELGSAKFVQSFNQDRGGKCMVSIAARHGRHGRADLFTFAGSDLHNG